MFATRALRQAAVHSQRQPMIKFLGPRSIPCTSSPLACFFPLPLPQLHRRLLTLVSLSAASVDHARKPHPESPSASLPDSFSSGSSHGSFSSYRDHAQQHGPLQKTIRGSAGGIGGATGAELGSVQPPNGVFFDFSELPARFRNQPLDMAEIEAVESGGAALLG